VRVSSVLAAVMLQTTAFLAACGIGEALSLVIGREKAFLKGRQLPGQAETAPALLSAGPRAAPSTAPSVQPRFGPQGDCRSGSRRAMRER